MPTSTSHIARALIPISDSCVLALFLGRIPIHVQAARPSFLSKACDEDVFPFVPVEGERARETDLVPAHRSSFPGDACEDDVFSPVPVEAGDDGEGRVPFCFRADKGWYTPPALRRFLLIPAVRRVRAHPVHERCPSPPRSRSGAGAAIPKTPLRLLLTVHRVVWPHIVLGLRLFPPNPWTTRIACRATSLPPSNARALSRPRLMVMLDQTHLHLTLYARSLSRGPSGECTRAGDGTDTRASPASASARLPAVGTRCERRGSCGAPLTLLLRRRGLSRRVGEGVRGESTHAGDGNGDEW
ncbi:hypothetical protein B0H19DRAFT_1096702 [Mycena capillaripes]|nr:hypothetical protein B0H19DRAFT_1096702 [Mycena capillaripes]